MRKQVRRKKREREREREEEKYLSKSDSIDAGGVVFALHTQ